MKNMTTGQINALAGRVVTCVLFVEMDLQPTFYLCSAAMDITWNGHEWRGLGLLASVDAIEETVATEATGYNMTLSCPDRTTLALALEENPQNRKCRIYMALFAEDDGAMIGTPTLECEGLIDRFSVNDSEDSDGNIQAVMSVSVENELIDFSRPRVQRLTDADQQRQFPGDRFFEWVADMTERSTVWPSKTFFQ
jgi:hypothetical protein